MNTRYHSWRAAVRIARRDAWRSKGRSFLVLAMLALPILGVSAADLTLRSAELSATQSLERELGRADARITDGRSGGAPVYQDPEGLNVIPVGDFDDKPWPEGTTDVKKVLPAGVKTLTDTEGTGKLRTTHGLLSTAIRELKAADPVAEGIMRLDRGRFPEKANEVAATTAFLKDSGLRVGSKLTARGLDASYRIVGAYELPDELKLPQINALPGAFLTPLDKGLEAEELPGTDQSTTYLVATRGAGGFTWNMVKEINTKGVAAVSAAVKLSPPPDSDVPLYVQEGGFNFESGASANVSELAVLSTVVGLAMLEICLLAGPAFAVGARRSRRQLGLVGANGGDRHHIRAIVLSGGLVIGAVAAVVGTVLGIALTLALRPLLEEWMGLRFGHIDIRPLELLGIALLAVITGLLAAIVPAVTASRQTVVASLTGRRGVRKSSRVLPVIGLIAVGLGASLALYGSAVSDEVLFVAGGSALAELGVVALTPTLVGVFGRIGRWLPLSPRLALRDAVRNRGRTAPAVAAVLAAVAGTVAVATYTVSSEAQDRAEYQAEMPHGVVAVFLPESSRDVPGVRTSVQSVLPTDVRADVGRISTKSSCSAYGDEGCARHEIVVPKAQQCPLWMETADGEDPRERFSKAERRALAKDWRCAQGPQGVGNTAENGIAIGDEKLLTVLGIDDPAAARALADGQVVSFDKRNVAKAAAGGEGGEKDGANNAAKGGAKGTANGAAKGAVPAGADTIAIRAITDEEAAETSGEKGEEPPGEVTTLAAHQIPGTPDAYGFSMIVPPDAAERAGLNVVPFGTLYSTDRLPSSQQRQKLDSELDKTGAEVQLSIESGFTSDNSIIMLALAVFAGLVTIGAAGIATGLAQADAEADLKTLSAVGAPPRVRRTLSGFQCGVVAAMGVVLGSASGVLPAIGLRLTERRAQDAQFLLMQEQGWGGSSPTAPFVPVVIPWETLGTLLIVVPLGAALLAALLTRSRGALARREAI